MAKSEFLAEFAKLGPIKVTNHVPSGSPEIVSIALIEGRRRHLVIDGCVALKRRGVALPKAKNTLEALLDGEKSIVLEAPFVEDIRALTREMEAAGFAIKHIRRDAPDVKQLRERLGLTQEQFALSFGLEIDAIRNWEYGRHEPDRAAKSYLTLIEHDPDDVRKALASPVA